MADPWNPIVDPGNVMPKTKGFTRIPWSFRPLLYRVLSYREAAVYLQIALHCGPDEVYHWGLDKIAASLGWRRTNALYACLNKLVETGFLLKKSFPLPGQRKYLVNVYQRPAVGFTLKTLKTAGYVGPGKRIRPDEFEAAYQLYEQRDRPHETAQFQFHNSTAKEGMRIGVRVRRKAPRSN